MLLVRLRVLGDSSYMQIFDYGGLAVLTLTLFKGQQYLFQHIYIQHLSFHSSIDPSNFYIFIAFQGCIQCTLFLNALTLVSKI